MAQKGRVYYRHKKDRPQFKQIIKVLSDPFEFSGRCEEYGEKAVKTVVYLLGYSGFQKKYSDSFCNFPDSGVDQWNNLIKPIEEVDGEELRAFLPGVFEGKGFKID